LELDIEEEEMVMLSEKDEIEQSRILEE